jgi:hypothetical protein
MTIDHYEPQKARPELTNCYDNLMYCCDDCNMLKREKEIVAHLNQQETMAIAFFDRIEITGTSISTDAPKGTTHT